MKKIQVDISFDDSHGASALKSNCLISSNYSTRVVSSDSRVRLLVVLLKKILHLNNLNTSYLGKWSLTQVDSPHTLLCCLFKRSSNSFNLTRPSTHLVKFSLISLISSETGLTTLTQ